MKKIELLIFLFALTVSAAPLFADDWKNLEGALKEQGIIQQGNTNSNKGPSTTEKQDLEGGGTRTVVTHSDGSRDVIIEGRTTAEPANHTMNFNKDGQVTSEYKHYSDGTSTTTLNHGEGNSGSTTTLPNGAQVSTVFRADGSSVTTSAGGGTEATLTQRAADGTITDTVTHADGTKTETTTKPGGERTTREIGLNGHTTSTNVNHADGTNTRTEYKDGKPTGGTRMSSGGYPRPIGEIVYDDKGVKLREVIKDRWGKIVEIIYFNPDGTESRRSKDPNGPQGVDAFGDSFGMGGTGAGVRDAQHEIGMNQGEHHDHGAQHDY